MPAPPPMKMSVNVPTISATLRRKTLSSIAAERRRRAGRNRYPREDGVRGRVPALPQVVRGRAARGRGRALPRLQVPTLQAVRALRAGRRAEPGRADRL